MPKETEHDYEPAGKPAKKKVVILGGGIGALTTAIELTDPESKHAGKYDITIYQMGWRLGGKGASGRNRHQSNRIEEHGLHLWLGFYDQSFRTMRRVFAEWEIDDLRHPWGAETPQDRWSKAFVGGNFSPLAEPSPDPQKPGQWETWPLWFPPRPGTPGDLVADFSLWDSFDAIGNSLGSLYRCYGEDGASADEQLKKTLADRDKEPYPCRDRKIRMGVLPLLARLLRTLFLAIGTFVKTLVWFVQYRAKLMQIRNRNEPDTARVVLIVIDLVLALALGLLFNLWRILWGRGLNGLDALDHMEFREFLVRYGARQSSVESPLVDSLYDGAFACEGGSLLLQRENFAAGAAIRSLLRIFLDYKGAAYWRMQAGMGDTVFTPLYEVLKKRGVKFRFFHRVEELKLVTGDPRRVARIRLAIQANLKNPEAGYDPLVGVRYRRPDGSFFPDKLMCWPSEVRYEQLEEGEELLKLWSERKMDLENPAYTRFYQDPGEAELVAGRDFHAVVLAIPVAALEHICPELMAAHPPFKRMVETVATVRTAAYQVWLRKDIHELGWKYARLDPEGTPARSKPEQRDAHKNAPVLTNFRNPLNTWGDMTELTKSEVPPEPPPEEQAAQHAPDLSKAARKLAYFCGPMPDDLGGTEPLAHVEREAAATLDAMSAPTAPWPEAAKPDGTFDSDLIITDYHRANTAPSERYTLSLAGTTKARLRPGKSGFANLVLAGDWTRNGFNVGCIEATVLSGQQAAKAVAKKTT